MNTKNKDDVDVVTYDKDVGIYFKVENVDDSLKFELLRNPCASNIILTLKVI